MSSSMSRGIGGEDGRDDKVSVDSGDDCGCDYHHWCG